MKIRTASSLFLCVCGLACAGPAKEDGKEVLLKEGGKERHWVLRQGGLIIEEHYLTAHGDLHVAVAYPRGVQSPQVDATNREVNVESTVKAYWPDGSRLSESSYRGETPVGKDTLWYPNGRIMREATFSEGVPTGTWRFYDRAGKLLAEGTYLFGKRQNGSFIGDERTGWPFLFAQYPMKKQTFKDGNLVGEEHALDSSFIGGEAK